MMFLFIFGHDLFYVSVIYQYNVICFSRLFINVIVNVNGIIIINVMVSFSCYFHISVSYQGHVNVNVIFIVNIILLL